MDDDDKPHFVELLRLLSAVDNWLARIDPEVGQPQPVPPGSAICADDRLIHPYEVSHAAWHSLSHAVDHLNCLRVLLADAGVIHMYAPYSLVRAALENACAAVWMLDPKPRAERLARRLRFAAEDIRNHESAKQLVNIVGPRSKEERISDLCDIARRAGIDPAQAVRRVGYREIVNAAASALGVETTVIPFTWSLCSGIAHGDLWTTLTVAQRVELPGAPPGIGTFKLTANVQTLMYVTTFAAHMTGLGWRLYDQRSCPP